MAYDMHIKFTGGDVKIEGASNHAKHKNEVPIIAWSWGATNSGNLHTGAGYAAGGKANVHDILVTKYIDNVSNALLQACCTGARADSAILYVTNATGEQTDFLSIELSEGVMVTSVPYQLRSSRIGEARALEQDAREAVGAGPFRPGTRG